MNREPTSPLRSFERFHTHSLIFGLPTTEDRTSRTGSGGNIRSPVGDFPGQDLNCQLTERPEVTM